MCSWERGAGSGWWVVSHATSHNTRTHAATRTPSHASTYPTLHPSSHLATNPTPSHTSLSNRTPPHVLPDLCWNHISSSQPISQPINKSITSCWNHIFVSALSTSPSFLERLWAVWYGGVRLLEVCGVVG